MGTTEHFLWQSWKDIGRNQEPVARLGVHHQRVNADRLIRIISARSEPRVLACWAATAHWPRQDFTVQMGPSYRADLWALLERDSIAMGEDYTLPVPCISILWFKEPVLQGSRLHSIFHLSEDHSRESATPEIEFHVVELPKLHLVGIDRQAD